MAVIAGENVGSKSTVKIMANIFISFIGAGILGLPFAFYEAGILEGTSIMLFVGLCSVKAMLLVIDCKHKLIAKSPRRLNSNGAARLNKNDKGDKSEMEDLLEVDAAMQMEDPSLPAAPGQNLTYGDVGYYALGNLGRFMVDAVIVVSQIGFCCAYLIFICENLRDYVGSLRLIHWLCLLLPPLFGLTLLRHLSSLAISSLFAQLSNLMAFAVVFWFDFEHFYQVESIHPREISLEGFPFFLAIAIYCYEGAGMILSLEGSLHKDVRPFFKGYFKLTMCIVTFLYISFGVCGYLSFGSETNEIITLNLPKGSALDFSMVVKSCLCLALFFTYPVMMFPVVSIIETKVLRNSLENRRKGNILRLCMVILTGIVVMAVPNFANLMALVGATCCTMIAFVMPAIFHMKIFKGSLTKWQFSVDAFLIVFGVAGSVVGTMDALVRLRETHAALNQPANLLPTVKANTTVAHFDYSAVPLVLNHTTLKNVAKWITTRPTPRVPISRKETKGPDIAIGNYPQKNEPQVHPTPNPKGTAPEGRPQESPPGEETRVVPDETQERIVKEPDRAPSSEHLDASAQAPQTPTKPEASTGGKNLEEPKGSTAGKNLEVPKASTGGKNLEVPKASTGGNNFEVPNLKVPKAFTGGKYPAVQTSSIHKDSILHENPAFSSNTDRRGEKQNSFTASLQKGPKPANQVVVPASTDFSSDTAVQKNIPQLDVSSQPSRGLSDATASNSAPIRGGAKAGPVVPSLDESDAKLRKDAAMVGALRHPHFSSQPGAGVFPERFRQGPGKSGQPKQ